MNLLRAVYCNQYAELKKNGRDASKARTNGTILISAMIILNIMTAILLLASFASSSESFKTINRFFRQFGNGRSTGRLLAIFLFILITPVIYGIFGRKSFFEKTVSSFEELSPSEQKKVEKKGLVYVLVSVGVFLVSFIAMLF